MVPKDLLQALLLAPLLSVACRLPSCTWKVFTDYLIRASLASMEEGCFWQGPKSKLPEGGSI